jgi:hypothetical protein
MKSLKEISQNIIPLNEGIFDLEGDDRLDKGIERDSTEMLLKSFKGNFSPVFFKDGSFRINGKLIISNIESTALNFKCKDFHGKLIIENCPNLETLEGTFFEKLYVFDGSITINQCPSLKSVKGLPGYIKGDLSITNCKKLKSYEGVDSVAGNFYWQGNGKKYTPEDLKDKVHVIKKIFCGAEEVEADVTEGLVNEAFNNPWLQRLAAQLKKYDYNTWGTNPKTGKCEKYHTYHTVDELFKNYSRMSDVYGRKLDQITNDDIDVYDMGSDSDKKALSKAFFNTFNAQDANAGDIVLVYDENRAEFIWGLGCIGRPGRRHAGPEQMKEFIIPHKKIVDDNGHIIKYGADSVSDYWGSKTEMKDKLLRLGTGTTVIVINTGKGNGNDRDSRRQLRQERVTAQSGMIKPGDTEQYQKIAAENLKRYKEYANKIKAEKKMADATATAKYDKILDEYEAINLRVLKLVRAITKDPTNFDKWRVDSFLEWIRDEERRNPNYKPWAKNHQIPSFGDNGLMHYVKDFMNRYLYCFGKNVNPSDQDFKYLDTATNNLKIAIQRADTKLRAFGF